MSPPVRRAGPGADADAPVPPRSGRPGETGARAQTTIDYAVGVSVFLLVVAFVFAFVPTMFDPFAGGRGESLAADRAAAQLSYDLLGDPATPYALDEECVSDFFNESADEYGGIPPQCGYHTRSLRNATLGANSTIGLNVTLERDGATAYSAGRPARGNSVVTAQRFVTIDGRAHRLYVRAW